MESEYGSAVRRQLICGLHVHVAVPGSERALAVYNAMRSYLPDVAALAANAPVYCGRDAGMASVRPIVAGVLPRQGVPPAYESWEELRGYCALSANPVGELVLRVFGEDTRSRIALSDSICTGLQLVNFCQDVARDFDRGRIYLPHDAALAAGYSEQMYARREVNDALRQLFCAFVCDPTPATHAGDEANCVPVPPVICVHW